MSPTTAPVLPQFFHNWGQQILDGGLVQQLPPPQLQEGRRPPDRHRLRPPAAADDAAPDESQDVALSSDPRLIRQLEQIDDYAARERWPEVVAALQQLLEGDSVAGDTFVAGGEAGWTSLQRDALRRIQELPPGGARLYQEVYGGVAANVLAEARQSGEAGRLVDVARRFLATPAGGDAARDLACIYFDRAEYLAAVRWFERLDLAAESPANRIRYALALAAVDRAAEAQQVIDSLADASASQSQLPVPSLREWWRTAPRLELSPTRAQADWPVAYGNATHTGRVPAGSPLLLEEWSLPMTYVPVVREQVQTLQSDLRDAGRACIPAAQPVIVGSRLAVRTLRGVEVVDLATGRPQWSQASDPAAPDRLLSGNFEGSGEQRAAQQRVALQSLYSPQEAANYDQHPLTGLVFQDSVQGTLSSDGERLFVLSQHAVLGRVNNGYWIGPQELEADPFGRDWSSNIVTAYDFASGAELWQVGGPRMNEPFDRPLAGTFFFGTPTPAEDELYVIGERDNEVSLFVLNRETGRPVFQQPLANAEARIDVDTTRRMWACAPAVSNGIVVCPTTTGWTVAVDRQERRLLWAHACEPTPADEQRRNFGATMLQPLHPLNVRWEASPPIIHGRRVVLAPPELPDAFHSHEPVVLCLDLETGAEQWRLPKEDDGLYVGGVAEECVVVVGRSQVRGVSLADGQEVWSATLPVDAPPSGRGLISGDAYLLPLAGGQLWSLRLRDGSVTERLEFSAGDPPLGNLAMSRGQLVSVDALRVRSFNEQSALESEIARRRARNPQDLWAFVREAQLARMRGDRERAVEVLLQAEPAADAPNADVALVQEFNQLWRACLLAITAADWHKHDREFELLTRRASPQTDPDVRRMAVERALAREDAAAAWRLLWPPADDADQRLQYGPLEVRVAEWEAGQLARLDALADASLHSEMQSIFATVVDAACAADGESPAALRLERRIGFHPEGRRLTAWLADTAARRDDFAGAEIRWRRLFHATSALDGWRAGLKLTEWLAQHELSPDAAQFFTQVEDRLNGLPAADQPVALEELAQTAARLALVPARPSSSADWSATEFAISARPRGQQEQAAQDVPLTPAVEAFYDQHRIQFLTPTQRLRVSTADGREFWSLPLRSQRRPLFDQTVGIRTNGLQAYSVWQGVLQALSLPDRRVRWTFPFDLRMSGANYVRNVETEEQSVLLPVEQFAAQSGLSRYRAPTGMVAAATADYVLLHGRRTVSLLDSLSGEVRWTRTGLPPQSMVLGDGGLIYGLPSDGTDPFVLRAVDGSELPAETLAAHAQSAIALRQGVLTIVEPSASAGFLGMIGLAAPKAKLVGLQVAAGEKLWTHSINAGTRVGWISEAELLLLGVKGELSAVDVITGARRELGVLPGDVPRDLAPVQKLADRRTLFLLFDRDWQRQSHYVTLPHLQINGFVVAVDRDGGGVLWQRRIAEQRLLTSQFPQSPVLTFFNQVGEDHLHQLQVALWDKRTGRPLLESDDLRVSQQTFQMEFDLAARLIRFLGHSLQVVIGPSSPAAVIPANMQDAPATVAPP